MLGLCLSYKIPGVVTSLRGNAQSATISTGKARQGASRGCTAGKQGISLPGNHALSLHFFPTKAHKHLVPRCQFNPCWKTHFILNALNSQEFSIS